MPRPSKAVTRLALVSLVLLLTLAATAIGLSRRNAARTATNATVDMTENIRFAPASVTISVGETVTWRNVSKMPHTVTVNAGGDRFDSGNVAPGQSYSRTFTVPGEYPYFCIPHQGQGMTGRLVVRG